MPDRRVQPDQDDSQDVPAWMTTFSDCMTLLLTFFVLLLSFSSFDKVKYSRLKGALKCPPRLMLSSVFRNPTTPENSLIKRQERVVDRTKKGSETPDDFSAQDVESPKTYREVLNIDAYADKRTFYLPSDDIFLGDGYVLNSRGRELLANIGGFMKMVPCKLVSGHISSGREHGDSHNKDITRAHAVVSYIINSTGIGPQRFRVVAGFGSAPMRYRGRDVVKIDLVNRDITRR